MIAFSEANPGWKWGVTDLLLATAEPAGTGTAPAASGPLLEIEDLVGGSEGDPTQADLHDHGLPAPQENPETGDLGPLEALREVGTVPAADDLSAQGLVQA